MASKTTARDDEHGVCVGDDLLLEKVDAPILNGIKAVIDSVNDETRKDIAKIIAKCKHDLIARVKKGHDDKAIMCTMCKSTYIKLMEEIKVNKTNKTKMCVEIRGVGHNPVSAYGIKNWCDENPGLKVVINKILGKLHADGHMPVIDDSYDAPVVFISCDFS